MNSVSFAEVFPYIGGLILCMGASAFFSGTEVGMFSLRRADREQLRRSVDGRDQLIMQLLAKPSRLISTLLIGNESVNVAFSALSAGLCQLLFVGQVSEVQMVFLAIALSLPVLLIFGEITPKTVAINTSMAWSRRAVRLAWAFGLVASPIRLIVQSIARGVLRVAGGKNAQTALAPALSEAEFKALVDAGNLEGEVDANEQRIIHKVFEFGDKTCADIMVERREIFALSYDLPLPRLIDLVAERGFSRVPIFHRTLDNVRGILYAKELLIYGMGGDQKKLADLLHEPLFVAQTMPLKRLFGIFKKRQTHMALVVNEYGKVAGLVTMEDLLEELFGEIRDERELQKSAAVLRMPAPGEQL